MFLLVSAKVVSISFFPGLSGFLGFSGCLPQLLCGGGGGGGSGDDDDCDLCFLFVALRCL